MTRHLTSAPSAYWREIAIALAAKFAALLLIYLLFFSSSPPQAAPGDHVFLPPSSQEGVSR